MDGIAALEKRLARIESRLVQLMLHMGVDPHGKRYQSTESSGNPDGAGKSSRLLDCFRFRKG
jgi:hypothetical protein